MEVVDIVEENLGSKISLTFKQARAVDSPRAVLDISRMLDHGVPEPRSLDSGVRSYLEHLRALA
jgi:hypothetical protein